MTTDISGRFNYERLLRFALPSVIMLIVISAYSIVDGLFVSNYVGKDAFAAVNLIYPAIMMFSCVGFMFGSGGSALVAKTMGEGDREKAVRLFSLIVFAALFLGLLISGAAYFLIPGLAKFMGAEGDVFEYAVLYGRILLLSLPAFILQRVFENFLVTAGKPSLGLYITIFSGVINIVLDALFIIVFPWGVAGAAFATVISQLAGGILPFLYFLCKNPTPLRIVRPVFDKGALIKTCTNGSSELMSNISTSFVGMVYNYQLMIYAGVNGVASFGVIMYTAFLFEAVFIGYSMGTAPIISYNYGARRHDELKSLFKKSLILISSAGFVLTALSFIAAPLLAGIFVSYDKELYDLTVRGFRIFSLSFLFSGFSFYGSAFFTALNNGIISAVISLFQSVIFEVIAVFTLPLFFDTDGIWASVGVARLAAFLMTCAFWYAFRKEYHYA